MKKEIAKKLLKIYLIEVVFFIVVLIIAWLSACIQYIGQTLIKVVDTSPFPEYFYRYNIISYFSGMIIFFAVFLFLYKRLMRKNIAQIAGRHIVFKAIYWVIAVSFAVIMLVGLCVLTMFDTYEPKHLAFITNVGWPVFTALFTGIVMISKKITQIKAHKDPSDNKLQ